MNSDPNFLNRWLDRNPMAPLTRARFYLVIPTFSYPVTWLGYSDIVASYNYTLANNFVIINYRQWEVVVNPSYVLVIAFENPDGTVTRYRFWTAATEAIYPAIPLYKGQLIRKNFRFEVWSVNGQAVASQASTITPIFISLQQNVDYRNATDTVLQAQNSISTLFTTTPEVVPAQPDQTNLSFWLDPAFGVTAGFGNKVSQWVDHTGSLTLTQAVGANQPVTSFGAIQFINSEFMSAAAFTAATIKHFYIKVLNDYIAGATNYQVINDQGAFATLFINHNPAGGGFIASNNGASTLNVPFAYQSGAVVIEVVTATGDVWTHGVTNGISTFIGNIGIPFTDFMKLIVGSPAGPNVGTGFNCWDVIGYTAVQTAGQRANTLLHLMQQGIPLPVTFPAGSPLVPNADPVFTNI